MKTNASIIGEIGEKLVCIELLKNKIKYWEMKNRNPIFDLIIEYGEQLKKVQIKTTSKNSLGVSFSDDRFDFLIFVRIIKNNKNEFFIIPIKDFNKKKFISFKSKETYNKYKNNFNILLKLGEVKE